jgi:hypothetical protein
MAANHIGRSSGDNAKFAARVVPVPASGNQVTKIA